VKPEGEEEQTGDGYGFGSHNYVCIMHTDADIDRTKAPVITPCLQATERSYQMARRLLDGVVPAQKRGVVHMWFAL